MKTSTLSLIFIVALTVACFGINGAEASDIMLSKRSCFEKGRICKTHNDCCSKKCVKKGAIPSRKCA
uniref:Putative calcin-like n=1 Tax=Superstitionia donensis TaxID=311983 RepID=A0A1V1WBN1_9SCOR